MAAPCGFLCLLPPDEKLTSVCPTKLQSTAKPFYPPPRPCEVPSFSQGLQPSSLRQS